MSEFQAEFKWALMQGSKMENFHWLLEWLCSFGPHHTFLCLALTKTKKEKVVVVVGGGAQRDGTSALCVVIIGVPRRIQEEN